MCDWFKNYPSINAEIQNEIVYKNYYNIIAVGTDRGLVVPVQERLMKCHFDIEKI